MIIAVASGSRTGSRAASVAAPQVRSNADAGRGGLDRRGNAHCERSEKTTFAVPASSEMPIPSSTLMARNQVRSSDALWQPNRPAPSGPDQRSTVGNHECCAGVDLLKVGILLRQHRIMGVGRDE